MKVTAATWIARALNAPVSPGQRALSMGILGAILLSVFMLTVEALYPALVERLGGIWPGLDVALVVVFGLDFFARIVFTKRPWKYLFSTSGIIDFVAFAPSVVSLALTGSSLTGWLRALRLFRIFKMVNYTYRRSNVRRGLAAELTTIMVLALAGKALVIFLEEHDWWIELAGMKIVISVIGFSIGVLLSTKLRTAQSRMYSFEDAISALVGSLQGARVSYPDAELMQAWARQLERVIHTGKGEAEFRRLHDRFIRANAEGQVPGPIWLNIMQNVEYLLHRMHTRTPPIYDYMLRHITILYSVAVILVVPGLVGMVASVLVVYVLGGMLLVIDSMDKVVEGHSGALIDADLSMLSRFNEAHARAVAPA